MKLLIKSANSAQRTGKGLGVRALVVVGSHPDLIVSRHNSRGPPPSSLLMNMFRCIWNPVCMFILICVELGSNDVWVFGLENYGWPHSLAVLASHVLLPPTAPHPTSGWAALACLVLLPMWFPAAALDWHIPMPGFAWRMGGGS